MLVSLTVPPPAFRLGAPDADPVRLRPSFRFPIPIGELREYDRQACSSR